MVEETRGPKISDEAQKLIHDFGESLFECGEFDPSEDGDYNKVANIADERRAALASYIQELERKATASCPTSAPAVDLAEAREIGGQLHAAMASVRSPIIIATMQRATRFLKQFETQRQV